MGVESEFDTIFDLLDARQKGFIEYNEILDFYQAFYFMPVARDQVHEAIKHVCGKEADGRCRKSQFLDLVVELERRRQVEQGSWWDFKALDTKDADRISVKEGLFLMKATHQEHFTTITWQSFLESRSHPHEDINYSEIRMWLCNWPLHGTHCGYDEVIAMGEKLDKEKKRQDMQRRKKVMNLEDDFIKAIEAQEKQQYSNKFRNEAKRKLNRWVQLGVESLLFDDGYDAFEGDGTQRNTVSVQDLMEAMDEKYDILREKLLWEATQKHVGESIWSSMRESEHEEQVLRVKTKETEYRVKGDFEKITQLSVSYQLYNSTLISMMGYERLAHLKYLKELQDKEKKMKLDGKTSDEIYQVFSEEHMQKIQGRATAGQLLIDLHKRHVSEREFVLSLLKGSQGRPLFAAEMVTEYVHYVTQQLIAAWEPSQLEYSAMAMGISERTQDLKSSCYDYDRDLHELLGLHRLHQDGASKRPDKPSGEHFPMEGRNRGIVDLQVEIMRAVLRKQMHERMMMSYMLQGKESTAWRAAANRRPSREDKEQRINELRTLCSNWRQSPLEYIRSKQNAHVKMLLEGTWLYHANKQLDIRGGHNLTLTQVSAHVMADLQQHHSRELERILLEMQHKDSKDLMSIWRREYGALNEEFLDGISAVILGTFELSFEELEIVAALEAKYDVLRDKLLMDALLKQYGEAEWKKMSEGDRQRLLIKLKLEERRLRQEGKFDQAAKLLGDSIKDKEALQQLMGKNREEFQKRLQQRLMEREKRKAMGLDSDTESDTEMQEEEGKRGNILKDLQSRHDEELNAIMMLLRQQQNQYLNERERQELLLRLRREKRRAAKESNFDEAAILLGLAERNKANMEEKLKAERERQLKLARERIAARKKKSGQVIDNDFDDPSLPPKGDLEAWRDAVLREMDRKHRAEVELLVTIVMDEGSEDVRDAARKMGKEGRQQRLLYLRSKAEGLNLEKKEEREENRDILEEAGAIKSILRHRTLQEQLKEGQEVEQEQVTTTLLADLQEEQEKESEVIMATIFTMNEEQLSRLRMDQIWSRHNEQGSNALIVLTQYEGVGDEDSLLKALDKKYDTLREKILKAALIKKVGEEKWDELSEEERHKMLYDLKQQERRLRTEGKTSEISQQLGIVVTSEGIKTLMGTERTQYEEKRRQKMELRKKRVSQGLDPIEEGEDEGISEDEDSEGDIDVLTQIEKRQDAEREALIAQLRGVEAQYLNERERQAELARLKREVRKARMEDGFHAAALVLGLAERHQAAADERLKQDRRRQEQLAKERLEAARKKRKLGTIQEESGEDLDILNNGDKAAMQDAVMKMLEIKHEKERATLLRLLQNEFSEEEKFIAENLMNEARAEKQQEIWNQRKQLDLNNKEEHFKLLLEAAILKLVSRRKLLQSTSSEVTLDEVIVSIMADLQLHQDKESETIIQTLPDKELGALKKLQKESLEAIKLDIHENVAIVITSTDLGNQADESQLVEALEAKYDALKDKLLAEALMKQMGEGEWARLSERERQLRLMKLKLEERRLRQEGKMDEASALLGDALKSQKALEALMGESKKAQEEKLRLRLEKRKQRLAEGMSEEDVDRLEDEEIKQEEEELKKQRRNILLDLDNRLDDEKAALLAALRGQGDRLQSEKERQAELARLRREQRRARHEDKFEAAALVMGLAQKADDAVEKDRKRQEQLAKERLEQRRRLKAASQEKKETVTPVMLPENENDKQGLQEAVIQEMEMKHVTERDFLMQLVQDESQGDLRKTANLMSEDKRQQRLGELKEQRRQWRESGPTKETEEEQTDILRKGVAVLLESRLQVMKANQGQEVTDEDVEVSLIADLQEKQDKEASYLMEDLESKSAMTLKQLKQVQFIARANGWNDNVAATVLVTKSDTEMVSEEQLLKALENKYDVMRDKLLAEALIKQTGQAEWAKLTERERQARLMKLKLQERKMRQENKFDEANSLLSQGIKDQAELARLLGATKTEQEEKLKQRLERKKQLKEEREAQGLEASDEVLDEIVQHEMSRKEVLEERKKRHNILEGLNNHFEDEKNALLAALRKQDDSFQGEKERQLALAKLRRDQRKLQDEEKFEAAAALFGLAQQHEKARETNYEKDKERQKQLAKERLAARRAKMAAEKQSGKVEHLTRSEIQEQLLTEEKENAKADAAHATKTDPISLVSTVMDEVDKKQSTERDVLVTLVDGALNNTKERSRLEELALKDLLAQLEALKEERRQLREDADLEFGDVDVSNLNEEELSRHLTQVSEYQEQQHRLLKNAINIKIEMTRRSLLEENRLSKEEIEEELAVMMLSELQQKQSVEVSAVHHVLEGFPGDERKGRGPPPHGLDKRHSMASIASGVGHSFKELFFLESTERVKSDEFLLQMKLSQRRARREGWLDNVAVTVFDNTTVTLEMTTEIEEITKRIQAREGALLTMDKELEEKKANIMKNESGRSADELDAMIAKLEKEYADRKKALEEEQSRERRQEAEMKEVNQELEQKEQELQKLDEEMKEAIEKDKKRERRPSEAYDADAMMAEIEAQFAAKKRAMQAQLERQRRQAMEKMAARKQKQEDRNYEDELSVALIHAAEKSKTQKEEAAVEQKNKQNQLMQDRLAARREQRRKAAEERAEAERLAQEEQKKREVSFEREKEKKKVNFGDEPKKKGKKGVHFGAPPKAEDLPGPGLIREKTVVDVDMSEDEKQHLSKMLLSHHSNAQWKLEKERQKRANELKERLEMRKTRIQDAATTILGLGERQKTMVENKKKDERERQIAMVKERVQRVRYERTQTMKFKGEGKKQFQDYLEKEESGLTEDEKMMKIADRINSQFKRDESSYRAGHKSAFTADDEELVSNSSGSKPSTPQGSARPKTGRLLGQKERERLIKSRQAKRREIKKVNNSISAAPDMDSLAKMIEDRKKAGVEQEEDDNGSEV
ncbi:trichohyalin-like isoform X3 [Lytechinus variegatus]|uniref:trichohyalin-like isoform X3 n=1 Tax=Lytechinus variegatus TaxID=7654 RepID=UPI001BB20872|nr:trichohyalin-like isoform X3 [Lytechinus variegatus]